MNEKSTPRCNAILKTVDNDILNVPLHTCQPNMTVCEITKAMEIVKQKVKESKESISSIYLQEMIPLTHKGPTYVSSIPEYQSVRSTLQKMRR